MGDDSRQRVLKYNFMKSTLYHLCGPISGFNISNISKYRLNYNRYFNPKKMREKTEGFIIIVSAFQFEIQKKCFYEHFCLKIQHAVCSSPVINCKSSYLCQLCCTFFLIFSLNCRACKHVWSTDTYRSERCYSILRLVYGSLFIKYEYLN